VISSQSAVGDRQLDSLKIRHSDCRLETGDCGLRTEKNRQ